MNWKKLCDMASAQIEATIGELPETLREQVKQLPITFERVPNTKFLEEGIEADALSTFIGAEFAEKGDISKSSRIILFLETLWNYAEGDEKAFREEIRAAFLQELEIFFGMDEGDLVKRGLK